MEILTRAQRNTIIQTQFVSVVSKVISDGIFNERLKKTLKKLKKTFNKRKKRAHKKPVKKGFFYIYGFN